jgi:hypothetical protein
MARSQDEKGADKANAIRKSQSRDRVALTKDIEANQKIVIQLNDEAAPIRAEVRKVEAEVGPIKYIAKFIYGEHGADENSLERAVTWIIILIVVVFDPLAVIMLLAAQMTFGWKKEQTWVDDQAEELTEAFNTPDASVGEKPTEEELFPTYEEITKDFEGVRVPGGEWIQTGPTFETPTHTEQVPSETPLTALGGDITATESQTEQEPLDQWNKMVEEAEKEAILQEHARKYQILPDLQVEIEKADNRIKPDLTEVVEPEDSKKKTYMMKDTAGKIQVKNRS